MSSSEEGEDDFSDYGVSMVSIAGPSQHDCGYCKGKDSSISFGIWAHSLTVQDYQGLIDRGWRRSGKYLYKPDLRKSCCPQYTIRLDTSRFSITKSQKKIVNKFNRFVKGSWDPDPTVPVDTEKPTSIKKTDNYVQVKTLQDFMQEPLANDNKHSFQVELEPASSTAEKFELYKKYQVSVHHDAPDDVTERGFKRFLVDSPLTPSGIYGSFHQKYMLDGKLIALAVMDVLPSCVSSVYFLYDPAYAFLSLGRYSVFREISLVQSLHLPYYYMGFYIHTCPKMNYKGQYAPSDLLDPVTYQWFAIEQFKPKLDQHTFVTFSDAQTDCLDAKEWTDEDLEQVFVLAGEGKVAPITYVVKFEKSQVFRKSILDYIDSVGLDLAHKMVIC